LFCKRQLNDPTELKKESKTKEELSMKELFGSGLSEVYLLFSIQKTRKYKQVK